jgi:hypothetical protein
MWKLLTISLALAPRFSAQSTSCLMATETDGLSHRDRSLVRSENAENRVRFLSAPEARSRRAILPIEAESTRKLNSSHCKADKQLQEEIGGAGRNRTDA